jgi:azurin
MMKVRLYIGTAVVAGAVLAGSVLLAQAPARLVAITGDDTMKYNVTTIEAKPGESIHLKLTSKGTMPKAVMAHNFVLLKLGTNVDAFTTEAIMARDTDYIPAKFKASVIASTTSLGPGESADVTFKAPAKAGTYQYLCSFPGHYASGMKGTLVVK